MKRLQIIFMLIAMATACVPALARGYGHGHGHSGVRFGVYVGPGWYGPAYPYYYYPPPYYYYPPYYPPVAPAAPVTYVEQGVAQPAPALAPGYWYYCDGTKAYYPYVKECPGGWQRVSPQPVN